MNLHKGIKYIDLKFLLVFCISFNVWASDKKQIARRIKDGSLYYKTELKSITIPIPIKKSKCSHCCNCCCNSIQSFIEFLIYICTDN